MSSTGVSEYVQKGSMPILRIQAHTSKIYGIDWSHTVASEIVTCSLDRTIKVWNVQDAFPPNDEVPARDTFEPELTIPTRYPVWRARTLPFGHGLLSLAQRGEAILEMYASSKDAHEGGSRTMPIEIFEGHTDVVKEFVWRKGGQGRVELTVMPSY